MIKNTNYYVVFHWMTTQLGLTGNELLAYAVIYGFTQDGETQYLGSQKYLSEAIGCSKNTAINALDKLVEKNLIFKTVENINGVAFNRYKVNLEAIPEFGRVYQKLDNQYQNLVGGIPEFGMGGIPKIGTSNTNIENYKENNKDVYKDSSSIYSPICSKKKESRPFKEVVDYLNLKAGTSYRPTSAKTQSLINARFNEGFTLDDFKKVIDIKTSMWKGSNYEQYLRPETLFGTKFESYLNQKPKVSDEYNNPNLYRDDSNVDPEDMWK